MFWMLFGEYSSDQTVNHMVNAQAIFQSSTMLWFSNKQRWRRGPDLQLNPNSFNSFCSSSLNSTAIIFVFIDNTFTRIAKVAIFNFQLTAWTDIPKMKEELQNIYYMACTMATLFGKQTKPRVLVVFNGIYEYNSSPLLVQFSRLISGNWLCSTSTNFAKYNFFHVPKMVLSRGPPAVCLTILLNQIVN